MKSKQPRCTCAAYGFPHRPGGGLCRYPDPPLKKWKGTPGKSKPTALRRRGNRKWLLKQHGLHPIRDRRKIAEVLPGLYEDLMRDSEY
jgi:hypothetical protein